MAYEQDPYPWTWELPAVVAVGAAMLGLLALHAGRGVACLVAGAGWRWPARAALVTSVPGLLRGDVDAGLDSPAGQVGVGLLWVWIAIAEAVAVGLVIVIVKAAVGRWGASALRGAASAGEAERLLGRSRLRRVRRIVRPDLDRARAVGRGKRAQ